MMLANNVFWIFFNSGCACSCFPSVFLNLRPKKNKPSWLKKHWKKMVELKAVDLPMYVSSVSPCMSDPAVPGEPNAAQKVWSGKEVLLYPKNLACLLALVTLATQSLFLWHLSFRIVDQLPSLVLSNDFKAKAIDVFSTAKKSGTLNLSQQIDRMKPASDKFVGCITPAAQIWFLRKQRLMSGQGNIWNSHYHKKNLTVIIHTTWQGMKRWSLWAFPCTS